MVEKAATPSDRGGRTGVWLALIRRIFEAVCISSTSWADHLERRGGGVEKGGRRMKYFGTNFGTKGTVTADEDRVALDRLAAIASRYRVEPSTETELPLDFPDVEA